MCKRRFLFVVCNHYNLKLVRETRPKPKSCGKEVGGTNKENTDNTIKILFYSIILLDL